MNTTDKIADGLVSADLAIERAITAEGIRVGRQIDDIIDELVAIMAKRYRGRLAPAAAARQIAKIDAAARAYLIDAYRTIAVEHASTRRRMAAIESLSLTKVVNSAVGFDIFAIKLTGNQITALLDDATVLGAPARDWWMAEGRQRSLMRNRYMDQVRQGMSNGETLQQITRRVRGPIVKETAKHQAEALVRTSLQSVNTQARLATFNANPGVVKGVQQISTLDGKTSPICIAYSGMSWTLPDYKPINGALPWNGGTPRHIRCRSRIVPVLKSWEEMSPVQLKGGSGNPTQAANSRFKANLRAQGFSEDAIRRARIDQQSSMDGQVAADLTFDGWLRGKSEPFQRATLGPGRFDLWSTGRIESRQLVNQLTGIPLSVDALESKYARG